MQRIIISVEEIALEAELNDSPTARLVWAALPIDGEVNTWGDEIYFDIPVVAEAETDARAEVEVGELAYWPLGHAFCIFFGPTPVSRGGKPRAYSPVNILGRAQVDASVLRAVRDGAAIRIAAAE